MNHSPFHSGHNLLKIGVNPTTGDSCTVTCTVMGNPVPVAEVECFIFDDIIIQNNSDQNGKKEGILIYLKLYQKDTKNQWRVALSLRIDLLVI